MQKSFVTTPLLFTKNVQSMHSARESSLQIQNSSLVLMRTETWLSVLKANPDNDWTLPQEIVDKTIEKYLQAYKMLTGKELA